MNGEASDVDALKSGEAERPEAEAWTGDDEAESEAPERKSSSSYEEAPLYSHASNSFEYFIKTALLILAVTLVRWFCAGKVGLGDSEAYYYAWSRHLDLSYFDHPPLIAWLIHFATLWGGDNVFSVRVPGIILSAAMIFMVYFFAAHILHDRRAGFYGALLFSFSHIFFLGGLAAAPDVALGFFWLLALLLLYSAVRDENGLMLVAAAVAFGLALLAKYNAVLFAPSALVYLLLTAAGRRLLFSRWMIVAVAVALAASAPVIIWNYQHDWASFAFHLHDRHSGAAFSSQNMLLFMGGQLLYFSPIIWAILAVSLLWLISNLFSAEIPAVSFLFLFTVPPLAFFFVVGAWTPESEPHWPAVGYLPLFALGGLLVSRYRARRFVHVTMLAAIALAIFVNVVLFVHILSNPFVEAWPENSYRAKLDISNELYGWDVAAAEISRLGRENPNLAFAASYHYTMCGQLEFALKGFLPVYCSNHRRDAFDFFPDSSMPPIGRDGLIVTDNRYDRDPRDLYNCSDFSDAATVDFRRGTKTVRTFKFTVCRGFRDLRPVDYKYAAPEPSSDAPVAVEIPPSDETLPSVPAAEFVEPEIIPLPEVPTEEKPVGSQEMPAEEDKGAPVPLPSEEGVEVPEPEILEI